MQRLTKEKSPISPFRQVLLPGHFAPGFHATDLYNKAFHFWKTFWSDVYKANGTDDVVNENDFVRSELISLVLSEYDEIVALHLYSILNLEKTSTTYHPYLSSTEGEVFLTALEHAGCRSAMPLEYLTVNAAFRKSIVGFSFAPIMGGLAYRIQSALGVDASLGRCRADLKVTQFMTDVGGVVLKQNVMMHNTPVDFCAVFSKDLHPHPDSELQAAIDDLWNRREDHSGLTLTVAPAKIKSVS
jgi:hypothetical protein